jgi:hypothetical protein
LDYYSDILAKYQARKGLLGLVAIGLTRLRGIYLGQANLDLLIVGGQERERVAVRDADDPPGQLSSVSCREEQDKQC